MKRKIPRPEVLIYAGVPKVLSLNPKAVSELLVKQTNMINYLLDELAELKGEGTKEERNSVRDLYFRRYSQKAFQLLGKDTNEDGKKISPQWSGKEGALIKADLGTHGPSSLSKYIELFFSDIVDEVAQFTRYKEKAGYGYPVFHGMIEKLKLSKKKPVKPCGSCGAWFTHYKGCAAARVRQIKTASEILEERINTEEAAELFGGVRNNMRRNNGSEHELSSSIG